MKVLVAEDDTHIRNGLMEILKGEGYRPLPAADGRAALEVFERERPDFLLLDIMMPGLGGYDVCREVRRRDLKVPIIFVSAKAEEVDKVLGLELGADDYILKPFGVKEVIARIRAVTRRCLAQKPAAEIPRPFRLGDLEIVPAELRARREDQAEPIKLSLRDVDILRLFFERRGQVLNRNLIYNHAWGEDYFPDSRTLDQHISQLRKKIERDPKEPTIIRTVHGAGYRYDD